MPGDKETIEQFAARIKAKYPQYKDVNDTDLVNRIVAKHPQYKDSVDFTGAPKQTQTPAPQFQQGPQGSVIPDYAPANQRQRTDSRVPQPVIQPLPEHVQTVGEKHAEEVGAAQQRINSTLQKSDPAIKSLLLDFKRKQELSSIQDRIKQHGADATGHPDLAQRATALFPKAAVNVSDEEVKDFKTAMEQDPNLAREALYEHAKLNPAEAKTIAADTYLLDSKDRAHNAEKILKNKQGIEKGDLDYSIWSGGQVKKPEGFAQSLGRGYQQRQEQFNDYNFLSSAKDEDIVSEMEKRRTTRPNEDDPVPVTEGLSGGFGQLLGAEGPTMAKAAAPALLSAATGGGAAAAAPWLGALLTSPDFYERGYANSFNRHYNELREQGHEPAEAVQIAKNRASFDAKVDVAQGAVMTAAGVKMGIPATTPKFSTGFLGAVKSAVREIGASTPEAAAQGGLGALGQVAKNLHSGKEIDEGLVDAALVPMAFHYGIKVLAHGAQLANPDLYKSAVDNMAKQPEEIVNKTIGEQVESGEITPEQANDVHLVIEDQRAQHQQLLNKAKEIVAKGKVEGKEAEPMQHDALNNPEEFTAKLQVIAEKAHEGKNELLSEKYGDDLINVAKQLFPKEPAKLKMKTAAPEETTQTDEAAPTGTAPSEPVPFSNQQVEAAKGFLQQGIENGTIDQEYAPFLEHADHVLGHIREEVKAGKGEEMKKEFGQDLVDLSNSEASYPIVKNIKLKDNAISEPIAEGEIPRPSSGGENIPEGSEGVRPSEQGNETTGAQDQSQSASKEIINPISDGDMTGITHAQMDETANEFGLTTYQEAPEKVATWDKQADERFAKDPDAMSKLLDKMRNGGQPEAVEQRMMIKYIADLKAKIRANPSDELLTQLKRAKDLSNIVGGRDVAKSLRARQADVPVEETLPDLLVRKMDANQAEILTPEQKETVIKQHEELESAKQGYKDVVDKREQAEAEQEVQRMKSSSKKSVKKTHEDYVKERNGILSKIREANLNAAKGASGAMSNVPYAAQLMAIAPHMAKLVKSFVDEGIDNLGELIKNIHPLIKDAIPEATEKDTLDIIAGKYNTKSVPRQLSKEELAAKDRLIKIKGEIEVSLAKDRYATKSKMAKAKDLVLETLNVPRTIMASADLSAPLRQGAVATISHPIIASKAGIEMLKAAVSQKNFDRWLYDLRESPEYKTIEDSGLYVADPSNLNLAQKEEAFMNNLAERIPLIGKVVKGSERAYVAYLNKMRVDLFNDGVKNFESEGKTFANSPELYKGLASFINAATGRGELAGTMKDAAPLLNTMFFSPRLIASRLQLLNPVYYTKLPKEVRIMALKDMAKFIGFGTSVLALAGAAGANVELDPRSPDFGKIHAGSTRWDIWGGFQQYIRVASQLLSGTTKSSATGKINDLTADKARRTRADVALTFFRGKLAPVPGTVWDYMAGKTATGEKFDAQKKALDLFTPMIVNDLKDAFPEQGAMALLTVGVPSALGVGVSTYGNQNATSVPKKKGGTKKKERRT